MGRRLRTVRAKTAKFSHRFIVKDGVVLGLLIKAQSKARCDTPLFLTVHDLIDIHPVTFT